MGARCMSEEFSMAKSETILSDLHEDKLEYRAPARRFLKREDPLQQARDGEW
jgi:hypothetical protein